MIIKILVVDVFFSRSLGLFHCHIKTIVSLFYARQKCIYNINFKTEMKNKPIKRGVHLNVVLYKLVRFYIN